MNAREKRIATWARKREQAMAKVVARGSARCRSCGRDKPISEYALRVERRGGREYRRPPGTCRTCSSIRKAEAARARPAERVERDRVRARATCRERKRERMLRDPDAQRRWAREHRSVVVLRGFLNNELKRGRLTKPARCSRCAHSSPEYRIAGWFPPGAPVARESVVWLCYPCLWAAKHPRDDAGDDEDAAADRRRRRARQLVDDPSDYSLQVLFRRKFFPPSVEQLAQNLAPASRADFVALHAENVARLRAEAAEVAADAAKNGAGHAQLWGLYSDVESPREREREVREAQGRQRRAREGQGVRS